jgi:hypothetical protein
MTITPSDPNQGTVEIDLLNENNSGTLELPPGIYTILVELTSGRSIDIKDFKHKLNAYREETVYIYPYMTTALRAEEYEFTETDFIADLYFTGTAVIPYSSGTDTYKPTKVLILKAVDNQRSTIGAEVGFDDRIITEAPIDVNGNWELYLPSNLIADDIKAPFISRDKIYYKGYPVFFSFTMQSQENPANTMQSRWILQEIVNKHGKRDIALEAKIRKITVDNTWGTVEGNSAVKTSTGYDVVYADDLDNKIILTVDIANNGIRRDTVEVKKAKGGDLTFVEDELDVVSTQDSVYITFKMPDDDVTVTAEFFIPKGNVLVHAADDSSGSYTARQVFVWLDGEGNPDDGRPITTGTVDSNRWEFMLPSEYQAYSGSFVFQFRLTRTGRPDILSRRFTVNVSQLASDAENTISLAVEIRTLTVTDTAGKGTITITVPDMRDADGYLTSPGSIVSGDYAAVETDLQATVTPTEGNYPPLGLRYAQTGSQTSLPANQVPASGSSRTYEFTMPSYNTTVTAQFFIPEGNVLIHAVDNSNGGYTAQQVFVWLDGEGNPESGRPITIGTVTGNTWRFTLPSEYQAYSDDFLFQFRLTKPDKQDILSRKFRVNVSELASDVENKISLAVEIRTLTVADTAGEGNVTITASEMRNQSGSTVVAPTLTSGDYAAEGTIVQATVYPAEGNYSSGLYYTPTGLPMESADMLSASGNSKTYTFTMPSYNTTVTAEFIESSESPISNIAYSSVSGDEWTLQGDERWKSPTISADGVARINFTSDADDASITIQFDVSSQSECDFAFISMLDNADATYDSGYYNRISGEDSVTITIPVPTVSDHFIDIGV